MGVKLLSHQYIIGPISSYWDTHTLSPGNNYMLPITINLARPGVEWDGHAVIFSAVKALGGSGCCSANVTASVTAVDTACT